MGNLNGTWTVIVVEAAAFDCLRGIPFSGGAHVAQQGREPFYPKRDVRSSLGKVDAIHKKLNDTSLFGRKQFRPQLIEASVHADVAFCQSLDCLPRGPPGGHNDFWGPHHCADLCNDHVFDLSCRNAADGREGTPSDDVVAT